MSSGGVSGLFAAHQLLKEGTPRVLLLEVDFIVRVKIIEKWFLDWFGAPPYPPPYIQASSRVGGRVESFPLLLGGGSCVELGAQWIHGRGECPLWKY